MGFYPKIDVRGLWGYEEGFADCEKQRARIWEKRGEKRGVELGERRGEKRGEAKAIDMIVERLLKSGADINFIKSVSGYGVRKIGSIRRRMEQQS